MPSELKEFSNGKPSGIPGRELPFNYSAHSVTVGSCGQQCIPLSDSEVGSLLSGPSLPQVLQYGSNIMAE